MVISEKNQQKLSGADYCNGSQIWTDIISHGFNWLNVRYPNRRIHSLFLSPDWSLSVTLCLWPHLCNSQMKHFDLCDLITAGDEFTESSLIYHLQCLFQRSKVSTGAWEQSPAFNDCVGPCEFKIWQSRQAKENEDMSHLAFEKMHPSGENLMQETGRV